MDLTDILLVLLAMWAIKEFIGFIEAARDLRQEQEKATGKLVKELLSMIPVKVERHHGCYYFFHELTDEFVVQGFNKQEVVAALKARYGTRKKLAVDSEDPVVKEFLGTSDVTIET